MIRSMTGFGKAERLAPNKKFSVEIRSLNSKQLDLSIKMPSAYRSLEPEIRTLATKALQRGKVEIFVTAESTAVETSAHINKEQFRAYVRQLSDALTYAGMEASFDAMMQSVLRMPDVVSTPNETVPEEEHAAKNLKIVVRAGAGYDNVDLEAASARGIVVMNTPGQNSNAVAELALAMMIFMARNGFTPGTGSEIQGKTLGIHAYGNVGKLVGRKGKAMGMNVIAYDPFVTDDALFEADGVKRVASVGELYEAADFLSLHIPATAQTRGSIGYELLMSMPKGATLVNTARKEVIDEAGVVRAMTEREDLKYITDIAPDAQAEMAGKFGKRFFATAKKMGAETAEANINAGLAAARQIVDFFKTGDTRFQVNR